MGRSRACAPPPHRPRPIVRIGVRGPAAASVVMPAQLVLRPLSTTSPTLDNEMRSCPLRAGLASCREADWWVLHDPRLWLRVALHAPLEKARPQHLPALEGAWDQEITGLVGRIGLLQFAGRFPDPSRWPSYYLTRQR